METNARTHPAPALADALADALASPEEARRRGDAARRAVIEGMSLEVMTRRHEDFYRRAIEERGTRGARRRRSGEPVPRTT